MSSFLFHIQKTALYLAVEYGNFKIVKALLTIPNIDVNIVNIFNLYLFMIFLKHGFVYSISKQQFFFNSISKTIIFIIFQNNDF